MGREHGQRTVVGVDGGVFEHYGRYRDALNEGLRQVMGEEAANSVEFKHVNDGSSLGAAYLAAAAVRAEHQRGEQGKGQDKKENRGLEEGPSTPNSTGVKSNNGGSPKGAK